MALDTAGRRSNAERAYAWLADIQLPDGSWEVVTDKGTIHAEVVVNAAGLWGREVAKLAGFELPLMTMEHQYFVTENIGAFLQVNNIANNRRQRWQNYPTLGLNALVGVTARF